MTKTNRNNIFTMMNDLRLTWLGQNGFILRTPETTIVCDLYLSDYCQKRSKLNHTRKMPIPILPEQLEPIDHYLITHAHIDHFDPETVGPILKSQPKTRFYCSPDCQSVVDEFFPSSSERFQQVRSEKDYALKTDIRLLPLPAAHEDLTKDADGEYIAMSYLLRFDQSHQAVFFAGDTIPFDGQARLINESIPPDYELTLVLPVNGRDAERAELGFKGNLTINEAIDLYHQSNADCLVPCHFGMFALNDLNEPLKTEYFEQRNCRIVIPEINRPIKLSK